MKKFRLARLKKKMNQIMVEIEMPNFMSHEMIAAIPRQRKLVNKLLQQGIITNYSLALDRSKMWVIFYCSSAEMVNKYVEQFPIVSFIRYRINELVFCEQLDYSLHNISLN